MRPPFVDVAWVREHRGDPRVRIVDARSTPHGTTGARAKSGAEVYAAGHVPGSVHLDYAGDLADPSTPYAARVAPADAFARVAGVHGIGDDSLVIAYDDGDVPYAARIVWMFRYYGHDDALVMAGGYAAWCAAGEPASTEPASYAPQIFTPRARPELRAERDEVLAAAAGSGEAQLLETQRDKTYALRDRGIPRAVRLSGNELLEDARGGRIAPLATLNALIDARGLDRRKRTIVSCGSGVSAAGSYFALLEAGFTDVAVYDGSWLEWQHLGSPTVGKEAPEER